MEETLIPKNWPRGSNNILKVIGVGGGGSNAVQYMYSQQIEQVDFVVCNTDRQALDGSTVPVKLQIGGILTKGLGAGQDATIGRKSALESRDAIEEHLGGNTQMLFIAAGMGGGTGTGASPVIAEIARSKGILTVGVVTLPARFLGNEVLFRAIEGVRELFRHVDSLLIIDNEKLFDIYADLDILTLLPKADEVLATAVRSIAEIITVRGKINMDFADVKKIMQNSNVSLMGIGIASGKDRVSKAVEMALTSPLLNQLDLRTAKRALVNITTSSGEHVIHGNEVTALMEYIKELTNPELSSKMGLVQNDEMGENIGVTIIATGFEMTQLPIISEDALKNNRIEVKYDLTNNKRGVPLCPDIESQITKKEMVTGIPALITDDPQTISELESEPALTRREMMLQNQKLKQSD
ncbi:MAG: cell division protein FtsZ [Bacteroidales bacterium]|nr:cell division protein FtsZ [Bacteroidales bacterium]